ncbi:hypothetical protein BBP40_008550 [Aspergillus hancockii]|nr:hypothetical protein BBP40_008550 [Aspergillus hancockii]
MTETRPQSHAVPIASATGWERADESGTSVSYKAKLVILSLSVVTITVALDATSISVALPNITHSLNGTTLEAFWIGTSFLLCSTVFQPSFGSLSNVFGRNPLVLLAIAFFLAGTILGGCAKESTGMLVGRSLQGIGGGGVITLSEIIITDLVPLRLRGYYFGFFGSLWSVGSVTGPIIGGGFSQNISWRWVFYINLPFIAASILIIVPFIKYDPCPVSSRVRVQDVNYLGTALLVGSTAAILTPLTWGGVMYDWCSWRTIAPVVMGALALLSYVLYERSIDSTRQLIPLMIFQTRTAAVSYFGTAVHGFLLWGGLYYLPLYFQAVKGYTPILSGVALFPDTFTVAPIAIVVGVLITKTGRYRWAIWLGWILTTIGVGLLCILDVETTVTGCVFLLLTYGMGLGMLFPSTMFAIQGSATPATVGIAAAMFSFFRGVGQTLGVALGGVTFQNRMYINLLSYPSLAAHATEFSRDAATLPIVIHSMPDGVDKDDLKQAFTDSLRAVWVVFCVLSAISAILSSVTKEYTLDRAMAAGRPIGSQELLGSREELRPIPCTVITGRDSSNKSHA